jgi:hypothetical protein
MEIIRHWTSPDGRRQESLVQPPDKGFVLVKWHNVVWPFEVLSLEEANRWCAEHGLPPIPE